MVHIRHCTLIFLRVMMNCYFNAHNFRVPFWGCTRKFQVKIKGVYLHWSDLKGRAFAGGWAILGSSAQMSAVARPQQFPNVQLVVVKGLLVLFEEVPKLKKQIDVQRGRERDGLYAHQAVFF